ncbi:GNAT family N-acetyltransferase [Yoonia sp. 2307UL14-13]|uniref:GNAT family N-acetyltransferase n=1 Tax=Yoonia sp. 2307UL14-13 TaxID=3126506 RepID=UPI0030B52BBB
MTLTYVPPNEFLTPRLRLRPSAMSDAEAIFNAYATDPHVTRYLSWRPHKAVQDTRAFLALCDRARAEGTDFAYVIEDRDKGLTLGMVEVRVQDHAVEYAYVLRRDHWGQGIMTEALSALADNALAHPAIWRVYALCDAENPASAKVMMKVGMIYEGVRRRHAIYPNLSVEPRDGLVYAKVC